MSESQNKSIYDIVQMGNNEFWICGENGMLKSYKSGVLSKLNYPYQEVNLLRFHKSSKWLYIATDKGRLLMYNLKNKTWDVHIIEGYDKMCFYDIIENKDESVLICGGASKISIGHKVIPKGFIIKLSADDDKKAKVLWSSTTSFVWALLKTKTNDILMTSYNGLSSSVRMLCSDKSGWKKSHKIKGLVYGLTTINDSIYFYGSKNMQYDKTGMYGYLNRSEKKQDITITKKTGFITGVFTLKNNHYAHSFNGSVISIKKNENHLEMDKTFPIYRSVESKNEESIVVGHGGGIISISE